MALQGDLLIFHFTQLTRLNFERFSRMGLEEGATWNYRENTILQNINFKLDGTSEVEQDCPNRGFKIIDDE